MDNLKLGYGGTKEEMERLIADANKVKKANGEMADLSIDSFADVTEAIHIVQGEMGITGTTAEEASTTIQGSVSSMKSAWKNLLTGLADENQNLDELFNQFIDSVVTVGENLIPRIQEMLPRIVEGISKLAQEVAARLPQIVETLFPSLLTGALNVAMELIKNFPAILESIIESIITVLGELGSQIWEKAKEIASTAMDHVKDAVYDGFEKVKEFIITPIKTAFDTVSDVFSGIYNTIKSWIDKAKNFVKGAIDAIKGFFHFKVELPKIKLPHFSIKPKGWELGDLLKGKIPKLGIEWYAKGGVFDEPTIFPTASGFKGVGEAGAEAVAPISVLQNYVSDAVRAENTVLADKFDELMKLLAVMFQQVIDSNGHSITIDGSTLVGWLDKKMAQNQSLQLRGV